ncbi:hypothetical protein O3M35_011318 [Rhynocoris fuscipes]|uniref:CDT1 Geminin-binding domain-containing protein n=1 Tax=Rhynocoris fuscipes TaxID=488301 RepID=A0AAW1CW59_9HEMI
MAQTTLESYFNSRKRPAVDDIKKVNEKVLILDKNETPTSKEHSLNSRTIIYQESPKSSTSKSSTAPKLNRRTPKTISRRKLIPDLTENTRIKTSAKKSLLFAFNASKHEENVRNKSEQTCLAKTKKSLLASFNATETKEKELKQVEIFKSETDVTVKTEPVHNSKGESTKKTNSEEAISKPSIQDNVNISSESASSSKTPDKLKNCNKDLDLGSIKKKLIKSSRLDDLRNALKKVNEGHKKLKEIQSRNTSTPPEPKGPTLSPFKAIEFEVPVSPVKMFSPVKSSRVPDSPSLLRRAVLLSPTKTVPNNQPYISPRKLFSDSFASALQKSPDTSNKYRSYERFSSLVCSGKPAFILPYHYRVLAETFRSVDTVVSIMQNRNETILFSKLKSSVQQLSRKNLSESHLGQIATIFPKAYTFVQQKVRILGNQNEAYELVIKPVFESREEDKDGGKNLMTPSILLERKRQFYDALVEIVKTHHEEFLKSLDPPLIVPKEKLTRWHPAFDVESCPEIKAAPMPQPPNSEKCTTARDVLSKARDLFMANPRMEKALERLSENNSNNTTSTSKAIPALANALKGIPKSLLEKVRARQAAKAVELLTRNPEENKRRYELTRLPELARILRNIFVTEKKNVIVKSFVIQKLCESYREILDQTEMAHHLNLLQEAVPNWVAITMVGRQEYVKLCKKTELSDVLNKLNQLVEKNSLNL